MAPIQSRFRKKILDPPWILRLTLGLGTLTVILWLFSVTGHESPGNFSRVTVLLTLSTALVAGYLAVHRRLRAAASRPRTLSLLLVTVIPLLVGFTGLEFEVGKGYYTDEGHYLHHARRVASGELFARTFIYPHLLYYLGGFALWCGDLFPGFVQTLGKVYGVHEASAQPWLLLRSVTALLGSLTVIPVFLLTNRVAGLLAGWLAAGLMVFSQLYHDGFHVNICDVPSAFFAALCLMFVGRLLENENPVDYLKAGITSGLAAATKYPAGVVAVAIIAVWALHRWRRQDLFKRAPARPYLRWGLIFAGMASFATFILINPSLLVHTQAALFGPRGLFFGVRQYSQGGWIGVTPSSNLVFYSKQLLLNFGWPIFLFASIGVFGLKPPQRRRLLELLPFPLIFFGLLCSMNMVVVRNLFPLVPAMAVLLGAAAAGIPNLLHRRFLSREFDTHQNHPFVLRGLPALLILVCLAMPAYATLNQAWAMTRPSTRDLMSTWIHQNAPRGAGILKESYTPNFPPAWFRTREQRFALKFPEVRFQEPDWDFLLLAGQAHQRFFRPEHQTVSQAQWYRDVFAHHELAYEISPGKHRLGPHLLLYRLHQPKLNFLKQRTFKASEAFVPDGAMRDHERIRWEKRNRFALFRATFAAGHYALQILGSEADGQLQVKTLDPQQTVEYEVKEGRAELQFTESGKYFLYLYLLEGSTLTGLEIRPFDF